MYSYKKNIGIFHNGYNKYTELPKVFTRVLPVNKFFQKTKKNLLDKILTEEFGTIDNKIMGYNIQTIDNLIEYVEYFYRQMGIIDRIEKKFDEIFKEEYFVRDGVYNEIGRKFVKFLLYRFVHPPSYSGNTKIKIEKLKKKISELEELEDNFTHLIKNLLEGKNNKSNIDITALFNLHQLDNYLKNYFEYCRDFLLNDKFDLSHCRYTENGTLLKKDILRCSVSLIIRYIQEYAYISNEIMSDEMGEKEEIKNFLKKAQNFIYYPYNAFSFLLEDLVSILISGENSVSNHIPSNGDILEFVRDGEIRIIPYEVKMKREGAINFIKKHSEEIESNLSSIKKIKNYKIKNLKNKMHFYIEPKKIVYAEKDPQFEPNKMKLNIIIKNIVETDNINSIPIVRSIPLTITSGDLICIFRNFYEILMDIGIIRRRDDIINNYTFKRKYEGFNPVTYMKFYGKS